MRERYKLLFSALGVVAVLTFGIGDALSDTPEPGVKPTPSVETTVDLSTTHVITDGPAIGKGVEQTIPGAPPLGTSWSGFSFLDNATNTGGTYFIPPDPSGAAGPNHVVNVGNVSIQWFTKGGVLQNEQSLQSFFGAVGPPLGTFTFDPKVVYDHYNERFVVITLERQLLISGNPTDDSYILVAVSKTSDPNAGWWFTTIHSKVNIGGIDTWADYPGLAVDDKAIYVTNNMYDFNPGAYQGQRLWIIDKAPFYTGGAASWTIHDPYTAVGFAAFATTTMPSMMYGTLPAAQGAYLISYSGLTNGGPGAIEFTFVIDIQDPLGLGGGPFFTMQFVAGGDIEDVGGIYGFPALPDAPQAGTAALVEVNDRRALDAVWRNNNLYATTTIIPNAGPDAGHTTAHWWRIDTSAGVGAFFTADEGNVGAEDLGADTYTFFPSIAVDKCDDMAIGFAASNAAFFPGAYYTGRLKTDPAGTVQSTGVLQAGVDYYYRTFGGPRNRWGDYSGCAIDPDDATFWVYNEHSSTRGTVFVSLPTEDGRWDTHWGSFTLGCQVVAVAIADFDVRALKGGAEINARFNAESDNFRVHIYRSDSRVDAPRRYKTVQLDGSNQLRYVDRYVEPGETYEYFIGAEDADGEFFSQRMSVTIPRANTALRQNLPNPFNPTTTIAFEMGSTDIANLVIYDARGRLVKRLVDGVTRIGAHQVTWDGTDESGNTVGSGVYFYRLETGMFNEARKMVLLK